MILFPKIIQRLRGKFDLNLEGSQMVSIRFQIPLKQSRMMLKIASPYLGFSDSSKKFDSFRYKSP
jgi:hypothetical protein